jgi:hypothetical protein
MREGGANRGTTRYNPYFPPDFTPILFVIYELIAGEDVQGFRTPSSKNGSIVINQTNKTISLLVVMDDGGQVRYTVDPIPRSPWDDISNSLYGAKF